MRCSIEFFFIPLEGSNIKRNSNIQIWKSKLEKQGIWRQTRITIYLKQIRHSHLGPSRHSCWSVGQMNLFIIELCETNNIVKILFEIPDTCSIGPF